MGIPKYINVAVGNFTPDGRNQKMSKHLRECTICPFYMFRNTKHLLMKYLFNAEGDTLCCYLICRF